MYPDVAIAQVTKAVLRRVLVLKLKNSVCPPVQEPSAFCWEASHCWVRGMSSAVEEMDLRHVGELHQTERRD